MSYKVAVYPARTNEAALLNRSERPSPLILNTFHSLVRMVECYAIDWLCDEPTAPASVDAFAATSTCLSSESGSTTLHHSATGRRVSGRVTQESKCGHAARRV